MLGLALIVLAAKVVPPPPAHCEDGKLVLQATYGDIVVTSDEVTTLSCASPSRSRRTRRPRLRVRRPSS